MRTALARIGTVSVCIAPMSTRIARLPKCMVAVSIYTRLLPMRKAARQMCSDTLQTCNALMLIGAGPVPTGRAPMPLVFVVLQMRKVAMRIRIVVLRM